MVDIAVLCFTALVSENFRCCFAPPSVRNLEGCFYENFKGGNIKRGVGSMRKRFHRALSVVLKSLSQGFYRTFLGPKKGFDRTFWGSIEPF